VSSRSNVERDCLAPCTRLVPNPSIAWMCFTVTYIVDGCRHQASTGSQSAKSTFPTKAERARVFVILFVSMCNYYNAVCRTATTISYIRGNTAGCLHACKVFKTYMKHVLYLWIHERSKESVW
jgi:hypothetical protein